MTEPGLNWRQHAFIVLTAGLGLAALICGFIGLLYLLSRLYLETT